MSKKAKTETKLKRLARKRARKAEMQARYQKYAEKGENCKSKRNRNKKAPYMVRTTSHPDGKCGNIGCIKCFGINFNPFLSDTHPRVPVGMRPQMYMKWKKHCEISKNS